MNSTFWLTNVRLETDYHFVNGTITKTNTACAHLFIKDGTIAEIVAADSQLNDDYPKRYETAISTTFFYRKTLSFG